MDTTTPTDQPRPLVRIVRKHFRWVVASVTILATAIISFESIRQLAVMYGFGRLSWLFPITLDAVAAYACDVWLRRTRAWKPAAMLTVAAIGGSLVANSAYHYLTGHSIVAAVMGAVPPVMLGWLLFVMHMNSVPRVVPTPVPVPVPDTTSTNTQPVPVKTATKPRPVPVETATKPEPVLTPVPARTVAATRPVNGRISTPVTRPEPEPVPEHSPVLSVPPAKPVSTPDHPRGADLTNEHAIELIKAMTKPSLNNIRNQLGVGTGRARKLIAEAGVGKQ